MNISEFAFRIIFLFIPGLISFNIVSKLTFHRDFKTSDVLLGSLVYGFVCYLTYYSFFVALPELFAFLPKQTFYFSNNLIDPQAKLNFREITVATLLAVPVGLISAALTNSKLLYKTANRLKISDKLDDIGVWSKAFESSLHQWIIIRDLPSNLMYRGWVDSFSDGLDGNEILLRDVEVYRNSDGDLLYAVPGLYISMNKEDNLVIEFQSWEFTENMNSKSTESQSVVEDEVEDE